jgi:hypothetical protein
LLIGATIASGTGEQIVTQSTTFNGVTVAVTAGNLTPETTVWDFAVVLSSPRQKVSDDLIANAALVDPRGRQYKALTWEGGPVVGTHRAGVLKFVAVKPRPDSIELRITRAGEKKPRSFSWLLSNGLIAQRRVTPEVSSACNRSTDSPRIASTSACGPGTRSARAI